MVWMASIVAMAAMVTCASPVPQSGKEQSDATRYLDDVASGGRWAIIPDCLHPEWPAKLVELSLVNPIASPSAGLASKLTQQEHHAAPRVVVRSGSHVVLWRDSSNTRVSLDAIALENGAMNSVVSFRLARGGAVLTGLVRGTGSAELQPSGRTERLP
jgi:Chaperone for flagella basal body P-ring formation